MPWLGYFASAVLVAVSVVLLVAGLSGKEGIVSIGKKPPEEPEKQSEEGQAPRRRVVVSSVVLGAVGTVVGIVVLVAFA